MFSVIVRDKAGHTVTHAFDKNCTEVRIGRADDNEVVLPLGNVSQHHSLIKVASGQFVIEDLGSTNGTYVNRIKVAGAKALRPQEDTIQIGHFTISLEVGVHAPEQLTLAANDMRAAGVIVGEAQHVSLLEVRVEAHVLGPVAGIKLVQRFRNGPHDARSALYVLPLEAGVVLGAVQARLPERLIKSHVHAGPEDGEAPHLAQKERPGVLVLGLGNLRAEETLEITVELATPLKWRGDSWRLTIPASFARAKLRGQERDQRRTNGLRITTWVEKRAALGAMGSASHPWHFAKDGQHWRATFESARPRLEEDLTLDVKPAHPDQPQAWLVPSSGNEPGLAMLHIPAPRPVPGKGREVLFLVDCSNEFQGEPFNTAQRALMAALPTLHRSDTFNVIWFGGHASSLWASPVDVEDAHLNDALTALRKASASMGARDLNGALHHAANLPADQDRRRCVVLLTDGGANDSDGALVAAEQLAARASLLIGGLHARGNTHLLEAMARRADAGLVFIDPNDAVDVPIRSLMARSHGPVWRDARVAWGGLELHQTPDTCAPMYGDAGQIVYALVHRGATQAVTVMAAKQHWQTALLHADTRHYATLNRLRVHTALQELEARCTQDPNDPLRQTIIEESVAHDVLSSMTSLRTASNRPIAMTRRWRQWPPAPSEPKNTLARQVLQANLHQSAGSSKVPRPDADQFDPEETKTHAQPHAIGRISYQNDAGKEASVQLTRDFPEITLGRNPGSVIRVNNLTVSRAHARFLMTGETVTLFDLESSHGSYVNGERIASRVLKNGDVVRCGDLKLRFELTVVQVDPLQPRTNDLPSTVSRSLTSSEQSDLVKRLDTMRKQREEDLDQITNLENQVERYRQEQRQLIRDLHQAQSALRDNGPLKTNDTLKDQLRAALAERDAMADCLRQVNAAMDVWRQLQAAGASANHPAPSSSAAHAPLSARTAQTGTGFDDDTVDADWLQRLLATQQPDGSFLMSRDLMRWLGSQTEPIMNAATHYGEASVITNVVVSLLTHDAAERFSDWQMSVERANEWLDRNNAHFGVGPLLGR